MLIRPNPPGQATEAFLAGLPGFLSGPSAGGEGRRGREGNVGGAPVLPTESGLRRTGELQHDAQEMFILNPLDLARGAGAEAARSVAWQFFAGTTPDSTVFGRCTRDRQTARWRLANISYGERAWQWLQASSGLDRHREVQAEQNYEMRVLSVAGLLVEAYWLVALSGGSDLVVVVPAPPDQLYRQLNAQPVYALPDFLEIVRGLVKARPRCPAGAGG